MAGPSFDRLFRCVALASVALIDIPRVNVRICGSFGAEALAGLAPLWRSASDPQFDITVELLQCSERLHCLDDVGVFCRGQP